MAINPSPYGPYASGYQFENTPSSGGFGGFMSSPGGAALINGAGGFLAGIGQSKQTEADRQQQAAQFAASLRQSQYNADRSLQGQRAEGVLSNDKLGADQQFAQHNALMAAILPNLRNTRSQPSDPGVAAAMGGNRGGIMNALPQGGFDPAMVESLYGKDATMGSLVKHQQELSNLDPNAPTGNLGSMFGAEAAPYQAQIQDWAAKAQTMDAQQRAQFDQQINQYVDQMVKQEQSAGKPGFWHKFAQVAGIVGGVAAAVLTGGAATPLAMAAVTGLGAASGAASAWGGGSNPLMGAVLGGGMAYAGAKMPRR